MQRPSLLAACVLAMMLRPPETAAQRVGEGPERTERFRVGSASMEPTLRQGSTIRALIGATQPGLLHRGEVILMHRNGATGISRIIGLPGDVLAVAGGIVTVNGEAVPRRGIPVPRGFTRRAGRPACYQETLDGHDYAICETPASASPLRDVEPRQVPPGMAYVISDNRDNAMDSRHPAFGFIPLHDIHGRGLTGDGSQARTPVR